MTPLQISFVEHYVENGGNGAQAARDAGYSENRCKQEARDLLRLPHVIEAIEKATLGSRAKYGPGVLKTLHHLMETSESEKTRLSAAQTLAKVTNLEINRQEITFRGDESLEEIQARIAAVCNDLGVDNPIKLVVNND